MKHDNREEVKQEHVGTPSGSKSVFKRIFSSRNRVIALISITVLLMGLQFIPGAKTAAGDLIYKIIPGACASTVSLNGSPEEMGAQHGQARKWSITLLMKIYVYGVICRNDEGKYQARTAKARKLLVKIDPRWTTEITAVAKAAGVRKESVMLGNTFLDLGLYLAGCRQMIVNTSDGMLHAHNLDWDNLAGVGNFLVTIFRTSAGPGRFATVYLGFPGMVGALDIINEHGIALSFNQVGIAGGKCDMPVFIKMREIAERCKNFEEAEKELLNMPPGMPFCIGLSDARSGKSAIFERARDNKVQKRGSDDTIVAADNNLWCGQDMAGHCTIDDLARKIKPDNIAGFKQVLRDDKVLMGCNVYSVIFDYQNNKFYLAAGDIPAAKGIYKEYRLFDK